ncbi:MAG: GNAT family N-acetyltransferase [Candidatus Omnitrophota bacterium]
MRKMFRHSGNFFSFEHSYILEVNGETAGMALTYNHEEMRNEKLRVCFLVLRYLRWRIFPRVINLLKAMQNIGRVEKGESYLSNIAVYPRFRGQGVGTRLIEAVENEAVHAGSRRLALDVSVRNERAINLYERLGHTVECTLPVFNVGDEEFSFFKMSKDVFSDKRRQPQRQEEAFQKQCLQSATYSRPV